MDDIKKAFEKFDSDGNGSISYPEAHQMLTQKLGLPAEKVQTLLNVYDRNKDGRLSYEEFIWFYWKIQEKQTELVAGMRKLDANGDGQV